MDLNDILENQRDTLEKNIKEYDDELTIVKNKCESLEKECNELKEKLKGFEEEKVNEKVLDEKDISKKKDLKEKGEELKKGKKFYSMIKGEKFLVQEYKFKNEVFYTIVG